MGKGVVFQVAGEVSGGIVDLVVVYVGCVNADFLIAVENKGDVVETMGMVTCRARKSEQTRIMEAGIVKVKDPGMRIVPDCAASTMKIVLASGGKCDQSHTCKEEFLHYSTFGLKDRKKHTHLC